MVTTILKPTYYDNFSCLGKQCKYTCCQGWDIILSKNEYTHIKNLKKPKDLETLTSKAFHRNKKDETTKAYALVKFDPDNHCMLLTENRLCSLQQYCGHKALPYACKIFPRSFTITSIYDPNLLEQHLSLGCEAVVKLIMELPGGITFESYVDDNNKLSKINYINSSINVTEHPAYKFCWEIKTLGVDILQNRSFSLGDRILLMGVAFQSIQQMESKGKEVEISSFIKSFLPIMNDPSILTNFQNIKVNSIIKAFNATYFFNNILSEKKQYLINISDQIYNHLGIIKLTKSQTSCDEKDIMINNNVKVQCDPEKYDVAKKRLDNFLMGREYILENILVTYFLYNNYPFYNKNGNVWDNYLFFVNIYNFLIFFLMGYLTENSTDDDFIHAVTVCSRELTHNTNLFDSIVSHLKETKSDTLAHMAILIK